MANQYDDFDLEDDDNENTPEVPAGLRKALKREQREKQKLAEELAEMRKQFRERSLKDVLESEGVNPKIAKFIPSEIQTPDEVKAWLFEYNDVFNALKSAAVEPVEVHDPDIESYQRVNRAVNTAQNAPSKMEDLMGLVNGAKTREDLDALTGNLSSNGRR
jgi:hypothetical protein